MQNKKKITHTSHIPIYAYDHTRIYRICITLKNAFEKLNYKKRKKGNFFYKNFIALLLGICMQIFFLPVLTASSI